MLVSHLSLSSIIYSMSVPIIDIFENIVSSVICPHILYQALTYLKSYNKFYEDISIAKRLTNEGMFKFSPDIVEI